MTSDALNRCVPYSLHETTAQCRNTQVSVEDTEREDYNQHSLVKGTR
jgi:hypothetical protein